MTARKLEHYFQQHSIVVVSEAPLANILNNPEATGRVAQWGIEFLPRNITYERRKAIKSQVLPVFIAEWTKMQTPSPPDLSSAWTMYFDGSKQAEGAGARVILISPKGERMRYVFQIHFRNASNNEVEYEALLHGMRMAKAYGATRLMIYGDSNLVVQQTMKTCDAISDTMIAYRDMYNTLEGNFDGCRLAHVSRASNKEADHLANLGSTRATVPPRVFLEIIHQRSIKEKSTVISVKKSSNSELLTDSTVSPNNPAVEQVEDGAVEVMAIEPTWMKPTEARRIMQRSKAFAVINGELYKRSVSGISQRCIAPEEGHDILLDIHQGTCGHHAGSKTIAAKAFRAGFYWPTALLDTQAIVSKCEACQMFATKPHAPASELKTIPIVRPFAQWGLDMVGPLRRSRHVGHRFLLVAVDKFSKWIEAMTIASATSTTAIQFFRSIVFHFGVPHSIITDNGSNFKAADFQEFCEQMGIRIN
ncbi:uncharacterized protein LOC104583208 [Brachypodium distachyon]|uniref:uncharacterized protein LOC104583208 n=1 Tax=Brachypodium distachyon TaxID=15368 RepID=UPI00052FEDB0|nr:uncharacterized protein LOC104583208 [Brachypodium distachyon]|eukprot:XP_010233305.1 uncharacterized protein LOC104583208 [Brachypodium distachyon]